MFPRNLIVLICLVAANSSAEDDKSVAFDSPLARSRYSVAQEIRDRVPVNFAAMNLRKSRLKNRSDKNVSPPRRDVADKPKTSTNQPKISDTTKISIKPSKYTKQKGRKSKRPTGDKSKLKKSLRFRTKKFPTSSFTSTQRSTQFFDEIPFEASNLDNDFFHTESRAMINSKASKETSGNSFANIKKAINALPQQMVTIVRDDVDCNDDPTKNVRDGRGPPCGYSRRWPGTGGNPAFWMNNVVPQNWELFY